MIIPLVGGLFITIMGLTVAQAYGDEPPRPVPLAQALQIVSQTAEIKATESEIRALELRYQAADLVLQPTLELGAWRKNERRESLSRLGNFKPKLDLLSAELKKPFSTGTELSLATSWESADTPLTDPDHHNTVDWQIGISQSLWRDGFGRASTLRRAREQDEFKQDLAAALLRRGQVLMNFETVYWDWAVTLRSIELQAKNVKRSQEILRWVQDRFSRSAAEKTDLLHAQALLTQRELRLATLKQSLTLAETMVAKYSAAKYSGGKKWVPDPLELPRVRRPEELVNKWPADELASWTQLQYLESTGSSKVAAAKAREVRETVRPELSLEATYGKNAIDAESGEAWRGSYEENHEQSSIGLVFKTGLDLSLEQKKVAAANAESEKAKTILSARASENEIAWPQLRRELADLDGMIARAKGLLELQTKKADAERERYRKGRSTAFQAITFEQDAAEAEITLLNLYATARKTEAKARLFAR